MATIIRFVSGDRSSIPYVRYRDRYYTQDSVFATPPDEGTETVVTISSLTEDEKKRLQRVVEAADADRFQALPRIKRGTKRIAMTIKVSVEARKRMLQNAEAAGLSLSRYIENQCGQ